MSEPSTDYQDFMVYELDDSGERVKLDGVTMGNLESLLHPEQVLVIVHEQIRRIFIWKGVKSPVRKRFISSRVASQLQEELVKVAAFHRCKIVSIDQGDELEEFLDSFGLESMPVEDKMEDLRYVRNIEKQGGFGGKVVEDKKVSSSSEPKAPDKEEPKPSPEKTAPKKEKPKAKAEPKPAPKITRKVETSPLAPSGGVSLSASTSPAPAKASSSRMPQNVVSLPVQGLPEEKYEEIKEKILKTDTPDNFKRQNLIIGHKLFGAVAKKVKVFGKEIEETDWEEVSSLPKGMIEIETNKIRAYFDDEGTMLEAIEILEALSDSEKEEKRVEKTEKNSEEMPTMDWTVSEMKDFAEKEDIEITTSKKADILEEILDTTKEDTKPKGRRKLPSIPKN